jgi:UDP-N-acetylenolpyruvoylglucosamine reductase
VQAGSRDLCIGGASIYPSCTNYVVAEAGCPSSDVQQLVEKVRGVVREKLGVELAPRICVW